MADILVFIQVHGQADIVEAEFSPAATLGDLHDKLEILAIAVDDGTFIFIDEAEEHEAGERHQPLRHLKHGSRVHVARCKRIATTVHFLDQTKTREFAPGARVRAVKEWAVHVLDMAPKDAAEHVLQLCNSAERPSSDTPLHQLVQGHHCGLCFDLVPEKRVEG
nr:hypothetical protein [uncultured Rhodopila sp.]